MKKLVFWLSILVVCLLISACAVDPGTYYFNYDTLLEEVVHVELVQYDNPNQKHFKSWVPNHFSDLVPFLPQNMKIIESLEEEKIAVFLEQLSASHILYTYYAFDSPKGICLRLVYENGDFEIINCNVEKKSYAGYIGRYTSSGEIIDFKGSFASYTSYEQLINDYFVMNI